MCLKILQSSLEKQLREKMTRLAAENAALREAISLDRALEADLADRAWSASSQDFSMIRFNRNADLIKDIELALNALENDSYGLCEICGESIAERRLIAIPSARLCVDCQEMVDSTPRELLSSGLGAEILATL